MIDLEGQDTPEVHLWRAVITQAIADATMSVRPPKETDKKGRKRSPEELKKIMEANVRERNSARDWLTKNDRNFRDVCEMAMLDPAAVLDRAQALAAKEWPSQRPTKRYEERSGEVA